MEWKSLWDQRFEDKFIAEDVARRNYELLFIEEGTVIKATKDYKPPILEEIMERNERILGLKLTYPNPEVGGWRKFSKEISKQARQSDSFKRKCKPSTHNLRNGSSKKRLK